MIDITASVGIQYLKNYEVSSNQELYQVLVGLRTVSCQGIHLPTTVWPTGDNEDRDGARREPELEEYFLTY